MLHPVLVRKTDTTPFVLLTEQILTSPMYRLTDLYVFPCLLRASDVTV